jgi:hypothetical protein
MTQPIAVARCEGSSARDVKGAAELLRNSITLSYSLVEVS